MHHVLQVEGDRRPPSVDYPDGTKTRLPSRSASRPAHRSPAGTPPASAPRGGRAARAAASSRALPRSRRRPCVAARGRSPAPAPVMIPRAISASPRRLTPGADALVTWPCTSRTIAAPRRDETTSEPVLFWRRRNSSTSGSAKVSDVAAEARHVRGRRGWRVVDGGGRDEQRLQRLANPGVVGLERRGAQQRAARLLALAERRQREPEVVGADGLIGRQLLGRSEGLGGLVPALDPLIGESEAAVGLRRFRVQSQRPRRSG